MLACVIKILTLDFSFEVGCAHNVNAGLGRENIDVGFSALQLVWLINQM